MKVAGLFFWLLAVSVSAQTNQGWSVCRYPIRNFAGQATVNLTPLFQWWSRQPPAVKASTNQITPAAGADLARPLSAWHRITGIKISVFESSWVVDAVIYDSPTTRASSRIILNHPPVAEEQAFYALKVQLLENGRQITNVLHLYQAATNASQQATDKAWAWLRSGSKVANANANYFTQLAAQKRETAAGALNEQKELEAARGRMQEQLDAIPAANGKYRIDWFALDLGQTVRGMAIYDLGTVNLNYP